MESEDLYRQLLGLSEPWTVERVELDMVHVYRFGLAGHDFATQAACRMAHA